MSKTVSKVLNKYSKKTRMRSSKKTKNQKKTTRMRSSKKTKKPKKTKRVRSSKRKLKSVKKRRLRNTIIKSMKGGVVFGDIELAPASVDTSVLKDNGDYLLRECSPATLDLVSEHNNQYCTLVVKNGEFNYAKIIKYDTNNKTFYFINKKGKLKISKLFHTLNLLLEHYQINSIPHKNENTNIPTPIIKLLQSKQQISELYTLLLQISEISTMYGITSSNSTVVYDKLKRLYELLYNALFIEIYNGDNLEGVISSIRDKINTITGEKIQITLTILTQVKKDLDAQSDTKGMYAATTLLHTTLQSKLQ